MAAYNVESGGAKSAGAGGSVDASADTQKSCTRADDVYAT